MREYLKQCVNFQHNPVEAYYFYPGYRNHLRLTSCGPEPIVISRIYEAGTFIGDQVY